jgi:hypothetical protein
MDGFGAREQQKNKLAMAGGASETFAGFLACGAPPGTTWDEKLHCTAPHPRRRPWRAVLGCLVLAVAGRHGVGVGQGMACLSPAAVAAS